MIIELCAIPILAALAATPAAGDFTVRVQLKHGHLRELYFGCAKGAGPGFDRGLDDLAPPPGIETGYTVLLPPVKKMPPFYRDIRAPGDKISWKLHDRVHQGKPITVKVEPTKLPRAYDFMITVDGKSKDMRKVSLFVLTKTQTLVIEARRRPDKEDASAPAAGAVRAGP